MPIGPPRRCSHFDATIPVGDRRRDQGAARASRERTFRPIIRPPRSRGAGWCARRRSPRRSRATHSRRAATAHAGRRPLRVPAAVCSACPAQRASRPTARRRPPSNDSHAATARRSLAAPHRNPLSRVAPSISAVCAILGFCRFTISSIAKIESEPGQLFLEIEPDLSGDDAQARLVQVRDHARPDRGALRSFDRGDRNATTWRCSSTGGFCGRFLA